MAAVTLKLWADPATDGERSCCSPEAVLRARRLAHSLGMPHLTLDLRSEFRTGVVSPFLDGYAEGRTPNPCVLCNGEVRIDAMIALAERLGAEALVTGHYARIADDGEGPLLAGASDAAKDQTYMLSGLRPASLARLRFPLADLTKPEVREIAGAAGLEVAGPGREPGPLLPRRPGQAGVPPPPRRARRAPRRARHPLGPAARHPPGPPQLHRRPAARPRGGRLRAPLRAREGRRLEPGGGRIPRASSEPRGCGSAVPAFTATPTG